MEARACRASSAARARFRRRRLGLCHLRPLPLRKRALPPGFASPGNHALKRKVRNDAAIGAAPSLGIDVGQRGRVLGSCRPDMHDVGFHAMRLAQTNPDVQRVRAPSQHAGLGPGSGSTIFRDPSRRWQAIATLPLQGRDDQARARASFWRPAFFRSLESRWRLRSRMDFGVTSTSSSFWI